VIVHYLPAFERDDALFGIATSKDCYVAHEYLIDYVVIWFITPKVRCLQIRGNPKRFLLRMAYKSPNNFV
jgi:hypothetical protein